MALIAMGPQRIASGQRRVDISRLIDARFVFGFGNLLITTVP